MVYMILGTGFEEIEAVTPLDLLRRADIDVKTAGIGSCEIRGSHGICIHTDLEVSDADWNRAEMVILPGGPGVASIRSCHAVLNGIRSVYESGGYVAAICAAPTILAELGITDGLRATCFPTCSGQMGSAEVDAESACVTSGHIITGASAGCAVPFGLALISALKGQEAAETVKQRIVIR